MLEFKKPAPWASTKDICSYLSLSSTHFHRLKARWIEEGHMKEGKHFKVFSPRCVRYSYEQMHLLAHRMGRIV